VTLASKIVFVNRYFHPDESATSRMLTDLAFRLAASGIRISVVTSRQLYDQPRAALPAYEVVSGVEIHRVTTASRGRGTLLGRALDYATFHLAASVKLLTLLSKGDIVVAKTDPPLISIVTSYVAVLRGAKLINWLQDIFPEVAVALGIRSVPGWFERLLRAARNRSLRRAAVNVVLGNRMRDHLMALGVAPAKIRTVPNWADVRQVTPLPCEHSATRRRLLLEGRFVIGYSGNLGRAHEFSTLLEAARALREEPDFAFLITGGGAKLQELRQAVESEHLSNFHFQPYQPPDQLSDSLAAADVHLVSLLPVLEGLIVPSKIYGILAAGRPAVFIGDLDGDIGTLVREHQCGIAVRVGDGRQLALSLRALRDDRELLTAMGARARTLAVSRYTSEHAATEWLAMLHAIAPQVAGSRSFEVSEPSGARQSQHL
jgi:colanic acid biosynthesis glycosyl transferase WcaI